MECCQERARELLFLVEDVGEKPRLSSRGVFRLRVGLEHMELRLLFRSQIPDAGIKWSILPILTNIREAIVKLSPGGPNSS